MSDKIEKFRFKKVGNLYQIHTRNNGAFEGSVDQIMNFAYNQCHISQKTLTEVLNKLDSGVEKVSLYAKN